MPVKFTGCGFSNRHAHLYTCPQDKLSSVEAGATLHEPAAAVQNSEQEQRLYSCYLGPVSVTTRDGFLSNSVVTGDGRSILVHVIDAKTNGMQEGLRNGDHVGNLARVRPVRVDPATNRSKYAVMLLCNLKISEVEKGTADPEVEKQLAAFSQSYENGAVLVEQARAELPPSLAGVKALRQACLEHLAPVDVFFGMTEFLRFLVTLFPETVPLGGPFDTIVALTGVPDLDNAYYHRGMMVFGSGQNMFLPLVALDVVGHEMAHGVVEELYALEYSGHSGALNESFADVLGCLFEMHTYAKFESLAGKPDWLIGEDFDRPGGGYMRNMENPTAAAQPQPDRVNGRYYVNPQSTFDHGGVHINSGIPNKIFTELHKSLGGSDAQQLLLQTYSLLGKTANFRNYGEALVKCTDSKYPSSTQSVKKFLQAANINVPPPTPPPPVHRPPYSRPPFPQHFPPYYPPHTPPYPPPHTPPYPPPYPPRQVPPWPQNYPVPPMHFPRFAQSAPFYSVPQAGLHHHQLVENCDEEYFRQDSASYI